MGFPGEISAPNLVNMRADYNGRSFLLATPESIVFQAELPALSGTYASIAFGSVLAGAYTAVKPDMVYTITVTDSDFNKPTIRGYIREDAATVTTIYIDMQDDTLASGYIITVFDDYDVFPRKPRRALDVNYIDYDLTFERLPPRVSAIQSVYVENSTSAFVKAFTPTVEAMSDSATISSYLWDVGDGTITIGTATDQDVTVSFPVGHRWVTFSSTDSFGVTQRLHFEVFVGDLITSSFTLHGAESAQWSGEFEGWQGSATMFDDMDIVDNQRLTVCVLDTNNGVAGPVNTNIALIGRYRREDTKTDGGDSQGRNLQDSELTIEGFGPSLANIPVPKFNVTDVNSPVAWNDIVDPSPLRVVWHVLTRYTTAATLMSFDSLTADLVYQSGAIAVSAQGCLSAINQVLERYNAQVNFSADGTFRVRRDTNFITVRSGLTTIVDLETQDMTNYQISTEYTDTVGQVTGGGLHYDPDLKEYVFLIAKAPTIVSTIGEEVGTLNGQILDSTDTQIEAASDLQERTASKLAQGRVKVTLSTDLFDSFRFLEPSNYDRYTATIPSVLNLRGKSYSTADFWQLQSISCTANIKEGTIQTRAVLVAETEAGTSGKVVAIIPPTSDVEIPVYPVMQPYSGAFNVNGALFNPEDFNSEEWGISPEAIQANEPKDGNAVKPMPSGNIGLYTVYLGDSTGRTTLFTSEAGAEYEVQVTGDGANEVTETQINYLDGDGQKGLVGSNIAALHGGSSNAPGTYRPDAFDDFQDGLGDNGGVACNTQLNVTDFGIISRVWCEYFSSDGGPLVGGEKTFEIQLDDTSLKTVTPFSGSGIIVVDTGAIAVTGNILVLHGSARAEDIGGSCVLIDMYVKHFALNRVDAFYENFETGNATYLGAGNGFLVDGADVSPIPSYDNAHTYKFKITGTGSPFVFKFGDTTSYADNIGSLEVKIKGPGAF